MNKKISFVLILLFLFFSFVGGFHHHEDETSHSECSLCIVSHQLSLIQQDDVSFDILQHISALDLPQESLLLPSIASTSLFSRAPPA
ncbi:MAG: hypothetical protein AB1422_08155 [bacterium]